LTPGTIVPIVVVVVMIVTGLIGFLLDRTA
jgi:hypothetical protein